VGSPRRPAVLCFHAPNHLTPPPHPPQVSAVVRGRPTDALRVLIDPASSTTILGPAREVEVMESAGGKQARVGEEGRGGECVCVCVCACE
jgi:hypothetical protein